jgi:hypothetical protein
MVTQERALDLFAWFKPSGNEALIGKRAAGNSLLVSAICKISEAEGLDVGERVRTGHIADILNREDV